MKNVKGKRWMEQLYREGSEPPGAVMSNKLGKFSVKKVSCNGKRGRMDHKPCPQCENRRKRAA